MSFPLLSALAWNGLRVDPTPSVKQVAKRMDPALPQIIDIPANSVVTVYDIAIDQIIFDVFDLHNLGIVPLKYSYNTEATATSFIDAFAGGIVQDDGLGSIVHLGNFIVSTITIYNDNASAARVSIIKANEPYRTR